MTEIPWDTGRTDGARYWTARTPDGLVISVPAIHRKVDSPHGPALIVAVDVTDETKVRYILARPDQPAFFVDPEACRTPSGKQCKSGSGAVYGWDWE